jgi:hypothetical protein
MQKCPGPLLGYANSISKHPPSEQIFQISREKWIDLFIPGKKRPIIVLSLKKLVLEIRKTETPGCHL